MPSTGSRPKHISLAWTSYKQGNEKHMLESKVRSERLRVSDSHPKTFPLFFSCGLAVSNVISTALISHGGAACVFFTFFSPSPCCFLMGVFLGRGKGSRRGRVCVIVFLRSGKTTTWGCSQKFFTFSEITVSLRLGFGRVREGRKRGRL